MRTLIISLPPIEVKDDDEARNVVEAIKSGEYEPNLEEIVYTITDVKGS